jgi:hypothetical protein
LHSGAGNKNAFKIELVKDFEMGDSNKTLEFLKMNPLGKLHLIHIYKMIVCSSLVTNNSSRVPVLETPDDPVFDSAIQ